MTILLESLRLDDPVLLASCDGLCLDASQQEEYKWDQTNEYIWSQRDSEPTHIVLIKPFL